MTFTAGVITGIICTLLVSGLALALIMMADSHRKAEQAMEEAIQRAPRGYQPVMRDSVGTSSPPDESTTLNAGVDITCRVTELDLQWQAGDELVCIQAGEGYVYMSPAAAKHYRNLLPRINESAKGGPWPG